VRRLRARLREEWLRQGRPLGDELVCPPRHESRSGLLSFPGVARRARRVWAERELEAIGLHECRHTAASWMNAAGVNPKIASVLMGHSTPERAAAAAAGAAGITLRRYTHALPGDLERARDQLDDFIAAALAEARETGS
jgi:integrase